MILRRISIRYLSLEPKVDGFHSTNIIARKINQIIHAHELREIHPLFIQRKGRKNTIQKLNFDSQQGNAKTCRKE